MLRLRVPDAARGEICAVGVAVPGDHPTALVVEPVGDQLPSLVVLQHVAVGGALELAQLTAGQERQRRLGADLLAQLLDRRIDPRVAEAQLTDSGLDLACSVLAAARGGADSTGAELHRRLARARVPHLLLHRDHTLYVVLADRAWQRAAAELHIRKQTLGYRIRRIEQITGRGLTRTEHIAEWWIALRAQDLLAGRNLS